MKDARVPAYCQVMRIAAADGTVKELYFPKALDLSRPKRPRTTFNAWQLERLDQEFLKRPYLVGKERQELASELGITEAQVAGVWWENGLTHRLQVKIWYQNRRTKRKCLHPSQRGAC